MKHRFRLGRILLPVAFVAVMAFASVGVASASTAAQTCPQIVGYLCLAEADGGLRLVPDGQEREYPDGLKVIELSNGTKSRYCIGASPFNFSIDPGEVITQTALVFRVAPTDFACLT